MPPILTTTYMVTVDADEYTVTHDPEGWVQIADESTAISVRKEAVPLLIEALSKAAEVRSA